MGKTLIGLPRGPAGPSPACRPAERRPSRGGGQGRSGGSALAVNPPPRRPLRLNRFSAQAGSEAAAAAAKQLNGFEPIRLWKTLSINSSECVRLGALLGVRWEGRSVGTPGRWVSVVAPLRRHVSSLLSFTAFVTTRGGRVHGARPRPPHPPASLLF